MTTQDTNAAYWEDYDGLAKTKHQLLGRYLSAWFPILASTSGGLLLYLDCHAGRGRHKTGDPGSPILVLELLLKHSKLSNILNHCRVHLHLCETDPENAAILDAEIAKLGPVPHRIKVRIHKEDYAERLSSALNALEAGDAQGAPTFAFVDPFGYKVSMALMNRLLRAGKTEILMNVMHRYIDMAIRTQDKDDILDDLFGTSEWRSLRSIEDRDERVRGAIKLFDGQIKARYRSRIEMRGDGDEVKYVLYHATNSTKGLREFKNAIYKATPDGTYTAYERDRPEQFVLLGAPDPPQGKIRAFLWLEFAGKTVNLERDIWPVVDASPYLQKDAHDVIRADVKAGRITNTAEPGKFVINHNPTLSFG